MACSNFVCFLRPSVSVEFTPHLRFSLAVMGPVTLGWCFALIAAVKVSEDLNENNQKMLWLWVTIGVLIWFIIDSVLSVATGFWRNVIPNAGYIIAYLVPLLKSKVLSGSSQSNR